MVEVALMDAPLPTPTSKANGFGSEPKARPKNRTFPKEPKEPEPRFLVLCVELAGTAWTRFLAGGRAW